MAARVAGAQLDPYRFATADNFQGLVAPLGVATVFPAPFVLSRNPVSRENVRMLVGPISTGRGALARLSVDFDIDVVSRRITWLATARFALDATMFTTFRYFATGA